MKRVIIFMAVGVLSISCGALDGDKEDSKKGSGDASASIEGAFLSKQDLDSDYEENDTDEDDIFDMIKDEGFLFNNAPDDPSDDDTDKCFDERFGALVTRVDGATIKVGAQIDLSPCVESDGDVKFKRASFIAKYYFEVTCTGADLSAYDGATFDDLEDLPDEEQDCETYSFLSQVQTVFDYEITQDGNTFATKLKTVEAEGNSDLAACEVDFSTKEHKLSNDCRKIELEEEYDTMQVFEGETFEEDNVQLKTVYTPKDIAHTHKNKNDNPTWFDTGEINVEIGSEYTAKITYSGGEENPEYKIDWMGDTLKDGTLDPSDYFSLLATKRSAEDRLKKSSLRLRRLLK